MKTFKFLFQAKKLLITVLLVSLVSNLSAQTYSEIQPRFLVSAEAGAGVLFGSSNLSLWGIHYRNQHKNGFVGNLKALYQYEKWNLIGLKYSYFSDVGNYTLSNHLPVADNVFVHYIAAQILGLRANVTEKLILGYTFGVGPAYYRTNGLKGDEEFKAKAVAFAGNFDFSCDYIVLDNLAVCANLSFTGSKKFREMKLNGEAFTPEKWNGIKFWRGDLTVGIKGFF